MVMSNHNLQDRQVLLFRLGGVIEQVGPQDALKLYMDQDYFAWNMNDGEHIAESLLFWVEESYVVNVCE